MCFYEFLSYILGGCFVFCVRYIHMAFHTDDFFEYNQSGGLSTKQSIIEGLPKCPEERFSVRNYQEKMLCPDTILVNYIADRKILESGLERCTLCSSIWQNRNGSWQMVFFQGTPSKVAE